MRVCAALLLCDLPRGVGNCVGVLVGNPVGLGVGTTSMITTTVSIGSPKTARAWHTLCRKALLTSHIVQKDLCPRLALHARCNRISALYTLRQKLSARPAQHTHHCSHEYNSPRSPTVTVHLHLLAVCRIPGLVLDTSLFPEQD